MLLPDSCKACAWLPRSMAGCSYGVCSHAARPIPIGRQIKLLCERLRDLETSPMERKERTERWIRGRQWTMRSARTRSIQLWREGGHYIRTRFRETPSRWREMAVHLSKWVGRRAGERIGCRVQVKKLVKGPIDLSLGSHRRRAERER